MDAQGRSELRKLLDDLRSVEGRYADDEKALARGVAKACENTIDAIIDFLEG